MGAWTFRDTSGFAKDALTVSGAALACGALAPWVTGLAVAIAAPAAALFGGTVAAALLKRSRVSPAARGGLGAAGGALAALGFSALAAKFGLGDAGFVAGGALGGLALGSLLTDEQPDAASKGASAVGALGATVLGAVGALAAVRIAAYGASVGTPDMLTSGTIAGLTGLWIASGAGFSRFQRTVDPLVLRAEQLLERLADPVKTRVKEALDAYHDAHDALDGDDLAGDATKDDVAAHARELFASILDVAENHLALCQTSVSQQQDAVDQKLKDLAMRQEATEDAVTLSHLARATQALRAQKAALSSLAVAKTRAEAAVDAQVALLDRLRLAVVQYLTKDGERFALEFEAVSDQVSRLTDDLDSLSAAMAEAESFSDRRVLAGVERAGRRALLALADDTEQVDEQLVHEHTLPH